MPLFLRCGGREGEHCVCGAECIIGKKHVEKTL